ncbi:hypothetical protein [Stackebrandtia soli]|uniref:hypothetical protein n=1 Tax=Stackebrandtia soli TaxID=1892856 RepID=UPI0039E7D22C
MRTIKPAYYGGSASVRPRTVLSYDVTAGVSYFMRIRAVVGASDVTPVRCSSKFISQ